MRIIVTVLLLFVASQVVAQASQPKTPATLKSIALQGLRETHNQKNWFVSGKEAMQGLTPEQAAWSDGKNHSVGQLVQHLVFWNQQMLSRFKGANPPQPPSNDDTFKFDPKNWNSVVKQYDDVMTELEKVVEAASEADVEKMAPGAARIAQHNAYHLGEIVMVRKEQGAWNPETGVK